MKHTGKVITEVSKISVIIFLFIPLLLAMLPPTNDMLFTFPVLIGIPKREQIKRVKKEAKSDEKAEGVSLFSIEFDRDFMIFLPPNSVESAIVRETNPTKYMDGLPLFAVKSIIIAINFCPS